MKAMDCIEKIAGNAIGEAFNPVCETVKEVANAAKDCHCKDVDLAETILNGENELRKIKETTKSQAISEILNSDKISSEDKIIYIRDFNDVEKHKSDNLTDVCSIGIFAGLMGFSFNCIKDITCTLISETHKTRRSIRYNLFHKKLRFRRW